MRPSSARHRSSARQPWSGSARWCSTPVHSITSKRSTNPSPAWCSVSRSAWVNAMLRTPKRSAIGRVGQARRGEIDGEHSCPGPICQGRLHRLLARSAACDQHLERPLQEGQIRVPEVVAQGAAHVLRGEQADAGPARVGAGLVLPRHLARGGLHDAAEPRHAQHAFALVGGFGEGARPRPRAAHAGGGARLLRPHPVSQHLGERLVERGHQEPAPALGSPSSSASIGRASRSTALASSALTIQTCSLIWHCCASARVKPSSALSAGGPRDLEQQHPAQRGQQPLNVRAAEHAGAEHFQEQLVPEQGRGLVEAQAARGRQPAFGPARRKRACERARARKVAQRRLGDELPVDGVVRERGLEPCRIERLIAGKVAAARQQRQPARRIGHRGVEAQGLGQARCGRPEFPECAPAPRPDDSGVRRCRALPAPPRQSTPALP